MKPAPGSDLVQKILRCDGWDGHSFSHRCHGWDLVIQYWRRGEEMKGGEGMKGTSKWAIEERFSLYRSVLSIFFPGERPVRKSFVTPNRQTNGKGSQGWNILYVNHQAKIVKGPIYRNMFISGMPKRSPFLSYSDQVDSPNLHLHLCANNI